MKASIQIAIILLALSTEVTLASPLRIGFFDSGAGGLGFVNQALKDLEESPNSADEIWIYVEDAANAPYGNKEEDRLLEIFVENHRSINKEFADLDHVVLACNTMSTVFQNSPWDIGCKLTTTFDNFHEQLEQIDNEQTVAIFATQKTVKSKQYDRIFKEKNIQFVSHPLINLATYLDRLGTDRITAEYIMAHLYEEFLLVLNLIHKKGLPNIGTIVHGCTHYPLAQGLMLSVIEKIKKEKPSLGSKFHHEVKFLDPAHSAIKHFRNKKLIPAYHDKSAVSKHPKVLFLKTARNGLQPNAHQYPFVWMHLADFSEEKMELLKDKLPYVYSQLKRQTIALYYQAIKYSDKSSK